jgi:hypothetical protein
MLSLFRSIFNLYDFMNQIKDQCIGKMNQIETKLTPDATDEILAHFGGLLTDWQPSKINGDAVAFPVPIASRFQSAVFVL